ncbi:unnamed protein product [Bursaphelenchus xylophilus]|uniref:(pine wood nematode) hypothetical protein n=1 Tax=Bursaphelenchus xylophilus TaxID=6326 RepID=A0A1I7RS39_BURXY|nr:unnamed protein product [Bursaphelenchus xylophilus]CAG9123250.1 unnamed protein product [Bursaphelenchus xylophilus]
MRKTLLFLLNVAAIHAISNCPMTTVKPIIQRAIEASGSDAALQMQLIRRIMEDIYGGTWGVLIVKGADLVSTMVHWTIPDHKHEDGSAAFCLHVEKEWQYNVFKTGNHDTDNRLTVEQVVHRLRDKQRPERMTVSEFDRRVANALLKRRQSRLIQPQSFGSPVKK